MTNPRITPETAAKASRHWPLISALTAFGLVAALALVIVYREANKPFGFEVEWMGEIVEHRGQPWTALAMVFNSIGGGILAIAVIPVVIIVALLLFRRPWAAVYYSSATILTTVLVQVVKYLVHRPRPTEILVATDPGSFPSGHSANAAVMAATLAIIFPRVWVWVLGSIYTIGMMLSRTYLGAHWISDTVGGLLIGIGVAIMLWAPLATRLHRESELAHPPIWQRLPGT
ncbi:phosphatase PAP2 family protein [Gulosibacter molinativorax]|uniref:PAP2 family protein n=1 Tax=Gulosibacter molinativorax TaxID=256821 RepID=A0ABT7CB76_9MICO|nr:phosphatase PAP2 family protein [Gulosibacter molinativorax]MDJ1372012.1 PAP2 family protein [Gulosibacter molinativorax]QUY60745.1 Phosphoesterase PA-phosphatase [Gulosibacter molinativorax]